MLVLGRKQNETICIGNSIKVVIVQTKDGSCRLGIEAPRDVPIMRGELLEADTAAAADVPSPDLQPAAQPALR